MSKVFIIGAAGKVGRRLSSQLAETQSPAGRAASQARASQRTGRTGRHACYGRPDGTIGSPIWPNS